MRIQAKLVIGDVTLDVDADVPEGERWVTLTNAPPSCLIIPRDRLPLAALGLSPDVLDECRARGLESIGQVIGRSGWEIRVRELSLKTEAELTARIQALQAASLVSEETVTDEVVSASPPVPFPIPEVPEEVLEPGPSPEVEKATAREVERREVASTASVAALGLPERIVLALKFRDITTVGDLEGTAKTALVMTRGLTAADIAVIEKRLTRVGKSFKTRVTKPPGNGAPVQVKPEAPVAGAAIPDQTAAEDVTET